MKRVILVLTLAALASGSAPRDKRSYAHTQAYPVPVSVHTVVRPSNTLPVYEYPESTQIDTHAKTVYTVQVPITHTVTLEQPSHSRQVIYHNAPAYNTQAYQPQVYQSPQVYHYPQVYQQAAYQPQVYQQAAYQPQAYHAPSAVYRAVKVYAPSHPFVYQRHGSTWC